MQTYLELIDQTFDFPTKEFKVRDDHLYFHDINLMEIIKTYGTPLKLTYLPGISMNIGYAFSIFEKAIKKTCYQGTYQYAYCTKSSYFRFVLEEVLSNHVHLETSSEYDIPIVRALHEAGKFSKDRFIICNGFKRSLYLENITALINDGFKNCVPVLDNMKELDHYLENVNGTFNIGIRVAADEEPNFAFYTSRLGIRYDDILPFFKAAIKGSNAKLKMLHFFLNSGIRDTAYYWSEFGRFMDKYCELKAICPELDTIDIGGGFPVKNSLAFQYDYEYMAEAILENIRGICEKNRIRAPHIFTEFGSFTVGESGAVIYSVLDQKLQNDKELWYMMDGSFITQMPDVWALNEKFILLPVNHWQSDFHKVNIGGLTCDSMDYYDPETHIAEVFMPKYNEKQPLYFGFFNTGAYQESLGGYGGVQHCLIPAPKHILIKKDANGNMAHEIFAPEQSIEPMMKILGF